MYFVRGRSITGWPRSQELSSGLTSRRAVRAPLAQTTNRTLTPQKYTRGYEQCIHALCVYVQIVILAGLYLSRSSLSLSLSLSLCNYVGVWADGFITPSNGGEDIFVHQTAIHAEVSYSLLA